MKNLIRHSARAPCPLGRAVTFLPELVEIRPRA